MVERIARAMGDTADAYAAGEGCDEVGVLDANLLLELAATAIAAMREPTEMMANSAWDAAHSKAASERVLILPPELTWRAMIEAALANS
jgi:hypothetical protein